MSIRTRRSCGASSAAVLLASSLALVVPHPLAAVDGVIEINQARALAGGVTATDDPGFPVTIDSSGSYRLTGSLVVDSNQAFDLTSGGKEVRLDLNGFSVTQTGTACCYAIYSLAANLYVRNGSIVGFPYAIFADGNFTSIESMHLTGVGTTGEDPSGIYVVNAAEVADSLVELYGFGIWVGPGSKVRGCTSRYNRLNGITAGVSSIVTGNSANNNSLAGIVAVDGSTITGNDANDNHQGGIVTTVGSTVLDNTARSNLGVGIHLQGAGNGYGRNVLTNNNGGNANPQILTTGAQVQLGTNVCGTAACP